MLCYVFLFVFAEPAAVSSYCVLFLNFCFCSLWGDIAFHICSEMATAPRTPMERGMNVARLWNTENVYIATHVRRPYLIAARSLLPAVCTQFFVQFSYHLESRARRRETEK